jgi:hypothetical protein
MCLKLKPSALKESQDLYERVSIRDARLLCLLTRLYVSFFISSPVLRSDW